jgi:hypothetical protein
MSQIFFVVLLVLCWEAIRLFICLGALSLFCVLSVGIQLASVARIRYYGAEGKWIVGSTWNQLESAAKRALLPGDEKLQLIF